MDPCGCESRVDVNAQKKNVVAYSGDDINQIVYYHLTVNANGRDVLHGPVVNDVAVIHPHVKNIIHVMMTVKNHVIVANQNVIKKNLQLDAALDQNHVNDDDLVHVERNDPYHLVLLDVKVAVKNDVIQNVNHVDLIIPDIHRMYILMKATIKHIPMIIHAVNKINRNVPAA